MAKVVSKAGVILGTNLQLNICDKGGTDVSITDNADGTGTIDSPTAAWDGSNLVSGINNRAVVVGDLLKVSHSSLAANEGKRVTVTGITSTAITYADTADGPLTTEGAGADINILAYKKTWQFLEASGLSFIDGVESIYFVSQMVDLWHGTDLDIYDPAFTSIEPRAKSMAAVNGWEPENIDTLKTHRDMALEVRGADSLPRQIYDLLRSGNTHGTTDQYTYWPSSDAESTDPTLAVTTGYINELVLIYDIDGADNRYTNGQITWFARCFMPGKTPLMEEFNLSYAEITPVASGNDIDPKLATVSGQLTGFADSDVLAGGIFTDIKFYSDIDGIHEGDVVEASTPVTYDFHGYLDATTQSNQASHVKMTYLLRQGVNINSGLGSEIIGTGDTTTVTFTGTLTNVPAADTVTITVDAITATDDGVGGLTGTGVTSGTIDYATGDFSITFDAAPSATDITATYTENMRGDKQWPKTSFSGNVYTLKTYIANFDPATRNDLQVVTINSLVKKWDTIYTVTLNCPDILTAGGTGAISLMHRNTHGSSAIVYLQNESAVPQHDILAASTISIVIAFSSYSVDGHTGGDPIELTVSWNNPGNVESGTDHTLTVSNNQSFTIPAKPDASYVAA